MDTASRGYLVTGDPRFLEHYNSSAPYVERNLRDLRKLTSDNRIQQVRLKKIDPEVAKKASALLFILRYRKSRSDL